MRKLFLVGLVVALVGRGWMQAGGHADSTERLVLRQRRDQRQRQTGNAIVGGVNVGQARTQASPCSFAQLLAAYPDAAIRPITGQLGGQPIAGGIWLKAGSGCAPSFTGNVDSLTTAVNVGGVNGTVTYDFEP